MAKAAFVVTGMTCGNCVKHVTKAVTNLPSVEGAKVEIGHVQLTYDPAKTSQEAIAAAIRDAGYEAEPEVKAL